MKFLPAQYHCRMFQVQIPDGESPSQYLTPPCRVNIITNCQTVNSFITVGDNSGVPSILSSSSSSSSSITYSHHHH